MKNIKNNPLPFKNNLIESNVSEAHKGSGKLKEIEKNPEKIIRVLDIRKLERYYQNKIGAVMIASLGSKLYKEIEDKYNIPTPVEYIISKDQNNTDVIYGITDRIDGATLDEVAITPETIQQTETLYTSISKYYLDKLDGLPKKEIYLTDISNASQYVFGTRLNDERPKIYLVDTDLLFHIHSDKKSFYYSIAWFIRHMKSVENRFSKKFDNARKNIEIILDNPALEELNEEEMKEIKKTIMESKNFLKGIFSENSDNIPTGI